VLIMRYVALDFETANSDRISPCSIGLAKMEDGKVLDTFHSYIYPPSSYFDPSNIAIHGITPKDIAGAPDFKSLWEHSLLLFIGNDLVIAHNAPFDIGILRAMLQYYHLPVAPLNYTCTVRISRKVWPQMQSHRLVDLSEHFGFEYRPHDALEDAINCGKVFFQSYHHTQDYSAFEVQQYFLHKHGIQFQRMTGGFSPLFEKQEPQSNSLF